MHINTTRFGKLAFEADDVLRFPAGLFGLEECRDWVLLADTENPVVGWMQSTTRPEVAFAVVSPRRFVPRYQVRVGAGELAPLGLERIGEAQVLTIVGRNERCMTLNLKAPLVINLERRVGRQVVNNSEQPLQHELEPYPVELRKSA
jgi:flagellar assembly factor FliW